MAKLNLHSRLDLVRYAKLNSRVVFPGVPVDSTGCY